MSGNVSLFFLDTLSVFLAPSVPKLRKKGAKISKWPENEGRHENGPQISTIFSRRTLRFILKHTLAFLLVNLCLTEH